jgi:hypothetical protein
MNPIDNPSRPQAQINRLTMMINKLKAQRDQYKQENKVLKQTIKLSTKRKSKKTNETLSSQ